MARAVVGGSSFIRWRTTLGIQVEVDKLKIELEVTWIHPGCFNTKCEHSLADVLRQPFEYYQKPLYPVRPFHASSIAAGECSTKLMVTCGQLIRYSELPTSL